MKIFAILTSFILLSGCSPWSEGDGTYDIYVDPNFTSADQELIDKAVWKWQDSVSYSNREAVVTFHYTTDWHQKNDLITISPSTSQALTNLGGNKFGPNAVVGYTTYEGTSSLIQVAIDQEDKLFVQATEHEIGHALGLGHTLQGDLMFHSQNGAAPEVTCNDVKQFCGIWGCDPYELNGCK